jgi:capsular polysaccharide export protein
MPLSWAQVIELCAGWRQLIDSNRDLAAVYGFAAWKRSTTEPLLWDGSQILRFDCKPATIGQGQKVATWKSRTRVDLLASLEQAGAVLVDVEDGFIRSAGLGANCVPPQSIVVDDLGAHFDARSPSRLELMLQEGRFSPALLTRARSLRNNIKALGISKYDVGQEPLERRSAKLHVLVPGQVEDDRAVLCTPGSPITNLELLRQVRSIRPEAHIIYKPHPDVEAGHRKGAISDRVALCIADEVVRAPSISSWIDLVDEVHVNSSLAGFEALMRDRKVTTHGVPFYAGWGLTEDLGPMPDRRTARRTLDELVAATLILYPRYVDPLTNLPCSPEVLIARLSNAATPNLSVVTLARRLQGWLMRNLLVALGRP